jgi:hypothetical protein
MQVFTDMIVIPFVHMQEQCVFQSRIRSEVGVLNWILIRTLEDRIRIRTLAKVVIYWC